MPIPKRQPATAAKTKKAIASSAARKTESFFDIQNRSTYSTGMRLLQGTQQIDPLGHYLESLRKKQKQVPDIATLRAFSDTFPAQVAIGVITNGILQMPVHVEPPEELKQNKEAIAKAKRIEKIFSRPNIEEHNSYRKFISAVVNDLVVCNVATVERQYAENPNSDQDAWLWVVDCDRIVINAEWEPQKEGITPRYWDKGNLTNPTASGWIPLYNKDLFVIQRYASSWRWKPPSIMEIVFEIIAGWLGLADYQQQTTSKASQEYILDLGDVSQKELEAFREFFRVEVLEKGDVPIIGSKGNRGVDVVKLGASTDEGLYLKYQEHLLRMIALAFQLSARDYNIQEHDNRATANVSADASFQKGILPFADLIVATLQLEVVDYYFPGYLLKFNDSEPRSETDEANTASMLYEKGILTKNEARIRVGEKPVKEGGDDFFSPQGGGNSGSMPGSENKEESKIDIQDNNNNKNNSKADLKEKVSLLDKNATDDKVLKNETPKSAKTPLAKKQKKEVK